jgi:hypothetical protein
MFCEVDAGHFPGKWIRENPSKLGCGNGVHPEFRSFAMKDQKPSRMFTGCNWFGLRCRWRLTGADCPPLFGQVPFLQLLHESTNMVENTKRLLHVVGIIVSVLGMVAIRVFEEAELRIHFFVEIAIWTAG